MEQQEKITVLYLDDETNNLNSFKATFRFDYNVLLAKTVAEADAHIENPNNHIQVILSDQRMPEMTGVEFFEKIRKVNPECVRLLITGFSDIESVIEAINRGHIFRYIKKPWAELDIKSAIEEAYKFYLATSMLAVKNIELQKAYGELTKFAYSVAHDFKGPVMSIQGALAIVQAETQEPKLKELVEMTISSANKLSHFVDNMFDYYKSNQGELSISDIDFEEVANNYRDLFGVEAALKNVLFTINVSQNQVFRSDLAKLSLVLNNLINNAFKFLKRDATDSKVTVNIEANKELATIEVTDNGIGIEPKYVNSIFEMFYRATTHAPGSGFGLFNVKDAISKLDGNIVVKSTPNEGSTFIITLPTK
jgi:two-component system, sensor histidine kinase and response regulator